MSLCDRCYAPGACCKGFILNRAWPPGADVQGEVAAMAAPFEPVERVMADRQGRFYWIFDCPHLTREGRCGVWRERPPTCSDFEPLSTSLCVHYYGGESGDPTFDGDLEAAGFVDLVNRPPN